MAQLARSRFTFAEYVRLEAESRVKHEFLDGVAYAMAGGTPAHAAIAMAIGAALSVQLSGRRCRVFSSDLRIRAGVTGLATYPDVTVICGGIASDPDDASTALNPTVVVEVASPSTEGYDRGEKLAHYKTIAELREVVIAAHDRPQLEVHRREADGSWSLRVASKGERAELASIGAELDVDAVYRDPLA